VAAVIRPLTKESKFLGDDSYKLKLTEQITEEIIEELLKTMLEIPRRDNDKTADHDVYLVDAY
jgi:hypothetical protein